MCSGAVNIIPPGYIIEVRGNYSSTIFGQDNLVGVEFVVVFCLQYERSIYMHDKWSCPRNWTHNPFESEEYLSKSSISLKIVSISVVYPYWECLGSQVSASNSNIGENCFLRKLKSGI